MKSTGVLKRIDELGRIVIPKEIRKGLKINDGETLEILIDEDLIVLKKYSAISNLKYIAQNFSDSLYDTTNENILITDRDNVIAASVSLKKYIGKELSSNICDLMNKSDITINNISNELYISKNEKESCKYVLCPILVNGAIIGSVILLSLNDVSNTEANFVGFIAKFLSKYFE